MISTKALIATLKPLIEQISTIDQLEKIILFGSFAREQQTITSDIDIALIFKAPISREARSKCRRFIGEFEESHAFAYDIQPTYISLDNYLNDKHPLNVSSSIRKEGHVLWQR